MKNIEDITVQLRNLNKRLSEGVLFFDNFDGVNDSRLFFDNVVFFGFLPEDILVLSLTPDGENTVIGRFITKDGAIYRFDFDLDDSKFSVLEKDDSPKFSINSESLEYSEYVEELAGSILLDELRSFGK